MRAITPVMAGLAELIKVSQAYSHHYSWFIQLAKVNYRFSAVKVTIETLLYFEVFVCIVYMKRKLGIKNIRRTFNIHDVDECSSTRLTK